MNNSPIKQQKLNRTSGFLVVFLGVAVFSFIAYARAQTVGEAVLKKINFDQNVGAQLPLDLKFYDETGQSVKLGKYFGTKPVILVLGYYQCPMLCNFVLNGMVNSLDDIKWQIGDEFDIVDVSIDPQEKFLLAAAKKQTYVRRYGRHDASAGWHFLTGEAPQIAQLAEASGFHFAYDAQVKEFAHPSGLIIVTPAGKISRYISGVMFSTPELEKALSEAGQNKIGSPMKQFFLMCFHYSPITGKYGPAVMLGVRITGIAVFLALLLMFVRTWRGGPALKAPASVTKA